VDKIEVLVLGGTWSFYPVAYQEEFIRDIYYAANSLDVDDSQTFWKVGALVCLVYQITVPSAFENVWDKGLGY